MLRGFDIRFWNCQPLLAGASCMLSTRCRVSLRFAADAPCLAERYLLHGNAATAHAPTRNASQPASDVVLLLLLAKYCNERVCASVCRLSVREHISRSTRDRSLPNFSCMLPIDPPPAGWRNPKGKGNFGCLIPHGQCIAWIV